MSDAAVVTIVSGIITVATMIVGLLTLWIKVKYGVDRAEKATKEAKTAVNAAETAVRNVENKIDHNTEVTTGFGKAAIEISKNVNKCNESEVEILDILKSYGERIAKNEALIQALEIQMASIISTTGSASKDIASTRHEVRGHLQTIMNKLDMLHLTGMGSVKAANTESK